MKSIFQICGELLRDECGAILSAEAALLGTVGVLGAGVGLSSVAKSVDQEMKDVAFAIRSLDQSYSYNGMGDRCQCSKAWTAGSSFIQKPVAEAHADLQRHIDALEQGETDGDSVQKTEPTPAGRQQAVAPKKASDEKQADAKREQAKKRQQEAKKRAEKQKEAKRKAEQKKREAEKKRRKQREKTDAA